MIFVLLSSVYSTDVEEKQSFYGRLTSTVSSIYSYLPSMKTTIKASAAAGCTALYFMQNSSSQQDHGFLPAPVFNGTSMQLVPLQSLSVDGSFDQIACLAITGLIGSFTGTLSSLLMGTSCLAVRIQAKADEREIMLASLDNCIVLKDVIQPIDSQKNNEEPVIFLGSTQSGKSTLIHWFTCDNLLVKYHERLGRNVLVSSEPKENGIDLCSLDSRCPPIGDMLSSCTSKPTRYGKYIDFPGIFDPQDISKLLCWMYQLKHAVSDIKFAKFVLVGSSDEIASHAGGTFIQMIDGLTKTFRYQNGNQVDPCAVIRESIFIQTKSGYPNESHAEIVTKLYETMNRLLLKDSKHRCVFASKDVVAYMPQANHYVAGTTYTPENDKGSVKQQILDTIDRAKRVETQYFSIDMGATLAGKGEEQAKNLVKYLVMNFIKKKMSNGLEARFIRENRMKDATDLSRVFAKHIREHAMSSESTSEDTMQKVYFLFPDFFKVFLDQLITEFNKRYEKDKVGQCIDDKMKKFENIKYYSSMTGTTLGGIVGGLGAGGTLYALTVSAIIAPLASIAAPVAIAGGAVGVLAGASVGGFFSLDESTIYQQTDASVTSCSFYHVATSQDDERI